MDSICYANEIYKITLTENFCKTHCTLSEIVCCYDNLKDEL